MGILYSMPELKEVQIHFFISFNLSNGEIYLTMVIGKGMIIPIPLNTIKLSEGINPSPIVNSSGEKFEILYKCRTCSDLDEKQQPRM